MSDLNNCSFTGRLTKDAERKVIKTGTTLVCFDVANNIGWGNNSKVNYITVNMWGKSGEGVFDYLKKGKAVGIIGELELQRWGSNNEHCKLVLNCNRLTLLSSGEKQQPSYVDPDLSYSAPEDLPEQEDVF